MDFRGYRKVRRSPRRDRGPPDFRHFDFLTPVPSYRFVLQIEREVILSNYDKNSKIPILNEYHRKHKSAAVAPDAPNVQVAWTEERTNRTVSSRREIIFSPNAANHNRVISRTLGYGLRRRTGVCSSGLRPS